MTTKERLISDAGAYAGVFVFALLGAIFFMVQWLDEPTQPIFWLLVIFAFLSAWILNLLVQNILQLRYAAEIEVEAANAPANPTGINSITG